MEQNSAWFAVKPRSIEDLNGLVRQADKHSYEIVKVIELRPPAYDNFLYGMDVERDYLAKTAQKCSRGDLYRCAHIIRKGAKSGGILVVPDGKGFVILAAKLDIGERE